MNGREFVCWLVQMTGLPWLLRTTLQRRTVAIVVYHRLDATTADRHFATLRRWYTPISLQAYLGARRNGSLESLPPRSVIVTIDDGHKSVYDLRSVLVRHQMPVTVFLCSGFVDRARRFWFSAPGLDAVKRQQFKTLPDEDRLKALQAIGFTPDVEFGEREALTLEQVRELQPLVDFESHSVSHPILPMCSIEKARDEIASSRRELEIRLGRSVTALAFPNGSYSERDVDLTREAGYECALTMDPGFNGPDTPLLTLKRLAVPDDCGVRELAVRTCGVWAFLKSLKDATRVVRAIFRGNPLPAAHRRLIHNP